MTKPQLVAQMSNRLDHLEDLATTQPLAVMMVICLDSLRRILKAIGDLPN